MASIFICGVNKGQDKAYSCPCCGFESDDTEAFATSMCWPCVMGNPDCPKCCKRGVGINHADSENGRLHRFAYWTEDGTAATVACGLITIPRDRIGQATAVLKPCAFCWPGGEGP